jgi:hypothetical protein
MQNTSARDIITTSLKQLSVQPGTADTLTADKATDGLFQLNLIMDEWNADGRMIYTNQIINVPLANGQPSQFPGVTVYTIGPDRTGGIDPPSVVVPTRPQYLSFASFEPGADYPTVDIPLQVLTADQYTAIRTKGVQSGIPCYIYMDENYPVANIYLWTVPNQTGNLVLTFWQSFNSDLTLDTIITLPPAYLRTIIWELAISQAPQYGKAGSPIVAQLSQQVDAMKRKIAMLNDRVNVITYSGRAQGVQAGGPGTYDVYTDEVL